MDARVCLINNPGVPERLAPSHPVYIRDSKASTLLSSYNLVATFFAEVCYFASAFGFDSPSIMKQCTSSRRFARASLILGLQQVTEVKDQETLRSSVSWPAHYKYQTGVHAELNLRRATFAALKRLAAQLPAVQREGIAGERMRRVMYATVVELDRPGMCVSDPSFSQLESAVRSY